MVMHRYLEWLDGASAQARANAARSLVGACGRSGQDSRRSEHIEMMLSALLDDQSLVVRCALAEAVSHALDVPRHIVAALARDDAAVSVPVLRVSPLLTEADLVDAVAVGDARAQAAIASRHALAAAVAAALAEVGHRDALLALCMNHGAELPATSARRMVERFGDDGALREAILARSDLDPALRHDLVVATAQALTSFAIACAWMSPERADCVKRESREKAAVTIALRSARAIGTHGPRRLVAHMRSIGHLTPALILRSLLSGNLDLFTASLSILSGMDQARSSGHVRSPSSLGFASLYTKAAMPPALLPVFRAALHAVAELPSGESKSSGMLSRPVIRRVLAVCLQDQGAELARVAALLRRFEAEALRDEIRAAQSLSLEPQDQTETFLDLQPWMLTHAPQRVLQSAA